MTDQQKLDLLQKRRMPGLSFAHPSRTHIHTRPMPSPRDD